MKLAELILFVIAYSVILITIFVSLICYRKKIEKWETVAFLISVLFLLLSLTLQIFFHGNILEETVYLSLLLAMITLSFTTPMNVLAERKHKLPLLWKKILFLISSSLFLATCISFFIGKKEYIEPLVFIYLGVSVSISMIFTWLTKPNKNLEHMEKINRIFAIVFFILVPVLLFVSYVLPSMGYSIRMEFTIPIAFTLLAAYKLMDDFDRLALFNQKMEPFEKHFKNYQISKREQEIAVLLIKGKTYKEISEELFISISTVKTHAGNIYKKCGIKNRNELNHLFYS